MKGRSSKDTAELPYHPLYGPLREVEASRDSREHSEELSQRLSYTDRRTGREAVLNLENPVFLNYRTGLPTKNSSYNTHLYKLCDETGIRRFCMHALRRAYATRAIERGVPPKVPQQLLGHASIRTTMDPYVHVTNDSPIRGIQLFAQSCTDVETQAA